MDILQTIAAEFHLQLWQVRNTVELIDDGNTIPFIARYRKEAHGTLDDQTLRALADRLDYLRNLDKRREEVRALIDGQEKLTDALSDALDRAATLAEIEDLYRPFRPKRKTRASIAKEKGLEPLADAIFAQAPGSDPPLTLAAAYVDEEKGVGTAEEALQGALDIIAETIADNAEIRKRLRNLFTVSGVVTVKATDPQAESVYTTYYDYQEPVSRMAGHRVLAVNRGEREDFLKVTVTLDPVKAANVIARATLSPREAPCTEAVRAAGTDAYDRLIKPSVEREIRNQLTETACEGAIKVFAQNTKQLLMTPPLKGKTVIGLDPGYRTGCKTAVVDRTGKVLETGVLYITHSAAQRAQAKETLKRMIRTHHADCLSIGNGTATKETEQFAAEVIRELDCGVTYMVVSEAGASVYSASKLAAEEFPQYDVSLRSAVSIARRLQDPLAELVKIDPRSIGVGQYQHDMPQKALLAALDGVVEDAVNAVGVDLNTASAPLLARVAGVNAAVAKNIVTYREENGEFHSRAALKKVPKLGAKAFEQCAGFLRVAESKEPLDNTGVHPESYAAAKALLQTLDFTPQQIGTPAIADIASRVQTAGAQALAEQLGVGEPTLQDIVKELIRPGRDPRESLPPPMLRTDVMDLKDLKPGMELQGTVRNVIDFGAFVDIGVHQDGLVHISQITDHYIKHPSEILSVGDVITVWVMQVDPVKKRISLTMKRENAAKTK